MAERTLLQITQTACDELGLGRPAAVVGSSDLQVRQLLALLNREGKELSVREGLYGGWPQLRKEHTFPTVDGTAAYDFPDDLQYFMNTTAWDRSQKWPLHGPISPQTWQVLKSGTAGSVGPHTRFRIMSGQLYLDPTPSDVRTIVLEYYSNEWCESSGGDDQSAWTADTDVPLLPDDCFILGLKWRFRKEKGLDYQEHFNDYEDFVSSRLSRSSMAPVLDVGSSPPDVRLVDDLNVPDTGYGGV